jgi:hypothetical protein
LKSSLNAGLNEVLFNVNFWGLSGGLFSSSFNEFL